MTNVLATIMVVVTTNWVTTSTTSPVIEPGHENDAVMRYSTAHQIGARVTNTVAVVEWKGQLKSIVLESNRPFYEGDLFRDISVSPYRPVIDTNVLR